MAGDYKVGDTVRVTFDAEVVSTSAGGGACLCNFINGGGRIRQEYLDQEGVTAVKIVEVFGPGDIVVSKDAEWGDDLRAVGKYGYLNLNDGLFMRWGEGVPREQFTSEYMERV